jgi:hypothetical protein
LRPKRSSSHQDGLVPGFAKLAIGHVQRVTAAVLHFQRQPIVAAEKADLHLPAENGSGQRIDAGSEYRGFFRLPSIVVIVRCELGLQLQRVVV